MWSTQNPFQRTWSRYLQDFSIEMSPAGLAAQAQGNLVYSICCSVIPTNYSRNQNTVEPPLTVPSPQRPLLYNGHCFWRTDLGTSAQRPRWGHKKVAFVEKFKQESMYALSAQKTWPLLSGCRCGEVAVSGSSTVQSSLRKRRGSNVQNMNAPPSIYTVYVTLYMRVWILNSEPYCFSIFFAEQEKWKIILFLKNWIGSWLNS